LSETLQFGIIGFGKLGLLHASIVSALEGCKWAAVVDTQKTLLHFLKAQRDDVRVYSDVDQMFKEHRERLHGVFISTPPDSHVPIALQMHEREIPFFIEKPLSRSRKESEPLLERLKRKHVPHMIGFMNRYSDIFRKAKEVVSAGTLGKITNVSASMYIDQRKDSGTGWRYAKETAGGGVVITQNCHLIDLLMWLVGGIRSVSSRLDHLFDDQIEDAARVEIQFENGAKGLLETSWSKPNYRTLTTEVSLEGTSGKLEFNDDELILIQGSKTTRWRKPDLFHGVSFDVAGVEYTRQSEDFIRAIRNGGHVETDVVEASRTQSVIDAIYESAGTQSRWTDIR
jgi:predicted dehydrogenase